MILEDYRRISLRILKDLIEGNLNSRAIKEFDFKFNEKVLMDILIEEFADEDFFFDNESVDDD